MTKTTPLFHERITLELHAFNVLNHTELNNLDNNAHDIGSTFGQVTGAYDPRILQLGAHLRFLAEQNRAAGSMTRSVSFSMLHSLVFFGIVVYFLPGGWTSAPR
ncbi:MAG TPA: hypothetical protein VFE61_19380 [Candidatus Sulfotelmatobacter sp.]|nr:hypothetical protein [Candidatus Sulfotelmatobacter sp.]